MSDNYPPGVTGSEYEIAGPDYERESDTPCPAIRWFGSECGAPTTEQGYGRDRWLACESGHVTDLEPLDDYDPDRAYDEERDRRMLGDQEEME